MYYYFIYIFIVLLFYEHSKRMDVYDTKFIIKHKIVCSFIEKLLLAWPM